MKAARKISYFAFISYSRKDSAVANMIHRKLEGFRYPSQVEPRFRPDDRRYVRDIFLDKKCLACTPESFRVDLRRAIGNSRYLIVVCSPNSAKPNAAGDHFVNDEIRCFLDAHDGDMTKVLPVIIEGGIESLPPALRVSEFCGSDSRNVPVLGEGEGSRDEFIAQILNYLLGLDLQVIRSRMNSQRVRFWRRCVIVGSALVALFMAMSVGLYVLKRESDRNRNIAQERAFEIERQAREVERQRSIAVGNERRARHQQEISDSALEFMMETFAEGDPVHSGRYGITVSEALENRVQEVGKLEPWELRAFMSARVGSLLDNVGSYASASNLLFSAYDLNKANRPVSDEMAYTLYQLSWWHVRRRNYGQAKRCAMEAVRVYESSARTNMLSLAQACSTVGMVSMFTGREGFDDAERYLRRAQELRVFALGPEHPKAAVGFKNLGFLYRAQKRPLEALRCFEQAVSILRKSGKKNDDMAQSLMGLALVYRDMSDFDEALVKFEEALQVKISTSVKDSSGTLRILKEIGNTYRGDGRYEDALKAYDESLRIAVKVLGVADPITVDLQQSIEATRRQLQEKEVNE